MGPHGSIESPFTDVADPQKVAALILTLDSVEWVERIHREEFDDSEWQKTGLDKPRHKVRLLAGDTSCMSPGLARPAVIENNYYMGIPGQARRGTGLVPGQKRGSAGAANSHRLLA
jgi:hypothetical protein